MKNPALNHTKRQRDMWNNNLKNSEAYYEIIWKKPPSLKPDEVLGVRGEPKYGFCEYYYPRQEDEVIKEKIKDNKNVLLIGDPLAGKSRAIYQALITINEPYDVIIPKVVDINLEDFRVPHAFTFGRKSILVLDDLEKFVEKQNFMYLLQEFLKRNTIIIASCRSGWEYYKLCKKMERELSLFGDPIEIPKISREEGEEVAKQTGRTFLSTFDGNIGSIFLQLDKMRKQFKNCSEVEKGVLRSIKRLYYAGIYREKGIFSTKIIKQVSKEKEGIEKEQYERIKVLKELENKGFIKIIKKAEVWAEEVYLEFVIEDDLPALDNLNEMTNIFSKDPKVLFRLGNKASHIGAIDIEKAKYMKIAIKAFGETLRVWTFDRFPMQYAGVHNNLGNAYSTLAEVEDRAENCKKAIEAFEKALKVRTLERFPMDYAMAQNNLGISYGRLAEVEDRAENCKRAIEAFGEALRVWTFDRFPMDYASIHNNLGILYSTLAEVGDRAENYKKVIRVSYGRLAEVEDRAENCKRAIEAFGETLRVWTFDRFPMQYAGVHNNLGNAYSTLAEVEDRAENCKKAIKAYEQALRVWTFVRFSIQYAAAHNNLGTAYGRLAEVKDKAENCKKAIKAYEQALKVFKKEEFPETYQLVQQNLRRIFDFCGDE